MKKQLSFHGKTIDIDLSETAIRQSEKLDSKLLIEIQVYFSCMLGKRLAFYADQPIDGTWQVARRGAVRGAGQWTHMYADPANTVCSRTP